MRPWGRICTAPENPVTDTFCHCYTGKVRRYCMLSLIDMEPTFVSCMSLGREGSSWLLINFQYMYLKSIPFGNLHAHCFECMYTSMYMCVGMGNTTPHEITKDLSSADNIYFISIYLSLRARQITSPNYKYIRTCKCSYITLSYILVYRY